MLKEDGKTSTLYQDVDRLVSALGFLTVEVTDSIHQGTHSMRVIAAKPDGDITTEDLAELYNLIYPRYSVIYSDRDLQLEVSSPGLQRSFSDVLEFSVFRGRLVRVYSVSRSEYIIGTITVSDDESVVLSSYEAEGSKEKGERISLQYSDIAKAKLEYRWEADNA